MSDPSGTRQPGRPARIGALLLETASVTVASALVAAFVAWSFDRPFGAAVVNLLPVIAIAYGMVAWRGVRMLRRD